MAAKITPEEVRETAVLARLELGDEETARLARELGAILAYMELLGQLDVSGVEPTTHAVPLDCPLAEDTPGPHLTNDEALSDAPRREGPFFEVPKIIEVGE
jgi:aspartyl-tRNA(Asn)/glutamyl-tRNA(Gln) amidotransferase subunit C